MLAISHQKGQKRGATSSAEMPPPHTGALLHLSRSFFSFRTLYLISTFPLVFCLPVWTEREGGGKVRPVVVVGGWGIPDADPQFGIQYISGRGRERERDAQEGHCDIPPSWRRRRIRNRHPRALYLLLLSPLPPPPRVYLYLQYIHSHAHHTPWEGGSADSIALLLPLLRYLPLPSLLWRVGAGGGKVPGEGRGRSFGGYNNQQKRLRRRNIHIAHEVRHMGEEEELSSYVHAVVLLSLSHTHGHAPVSLCVPPHRLNSIWDGAGEGDKNSRPEPSSVRGSSGGRPCMEKRAERGPL